MARSEGQTNDPSFFGVSQEVNQALIVINRDSVEEEDAPQDTSAQDKTNNKDKKANGPFDPAIFY